MSEVHPTHPGEFFQEELIYRGLTVRQAMLELDWTRVDIVDFIAGHIPVDEDLAKAIGKLLGTSAGLWLNLQRLYDEGKS